MDPVPPPTGKAKYAWREVEVAGLPEGSSERRIADFHEIYFLYDEAMVRAQASRCLECPEASCVTCCPLHNRIPEWMALAAEGEFLRAAEVSRATSDTPDFCAKVCPQERVCESACILTGRSDPVCIGAIERFISEYAVAEGAVKVEPPATKGFKAAVVGSGPGALACADELARRGHSVTVFESAWLPDGLLMSGIPGFKLARPVVERRLNVLRQRGAKVRLEVAVGRDVPPADLVPRFDAVFLGLGTVRARSLDIPGAALKGVCQALPFLVQHNVAVRLEMAPMEVKDRRVVVLGGGDSAMECLRTAIRAGAKDVVCVYRRDQASMPAGPEQYAAAVADGAQFRFLTSPVAMGSGADGQVTGVRCLKMELGSPDPSGRPEPRSVAGTEFPVPADVVIAAYGFARTALPSPGDWSAIAFHTDGAPIIDENQMTSMPGVFTGADTSRGPSFVVDAVRAGRHAAKGMDRYLTARKRPKA